MENQSQVKSSLSGDLPSKVTASTPATLSDNEKQKFAAMLSKVFDLQKQFGKTPSQLNNIVDGFLWALQGYPIDRIIDGFRQYIRRKSDMPTPSDIINIIDPLPPKPEFARAYYVHLRKLKDEQGEFRAQLG